MAAHESGDFTGSFTDLMTSLAIVFLILAVTMVIQNVLSASEHAEIGRRYTEDYGKILEHRSQLLEKIRSEFNLQKIGNAEMTEDNCVRVELQGLFRLVIQFNGFEPECLKTGLFFEENEFILNYLKTKSNIRKLANIYARLCEEPTMRESIENVQIVGHTDAKTTYLDAINCKNAFTGTGPNRDIIQLAQEFQCGNMYLSSQRARSVFLLVGEELKNSQSDAVVQCYKELTESSGRGPFSPKIDSNTQQPLDPTDPQQKRVEIVFNFKQPSPHIEAQ